MLMSGYPVHVRARRDSPPPGRWLWLVKWLLLVPHYVVLFVLWTAFAVLTLFAYIAVLITGRYPQSIFEFNVGVLRWTWRVGYYGYQVLGTDRYPPFTLAEVPDYPAGLRIDPPLRLDQGDAEPDDEPRGPQHPSFGAASNRPVMVEAPHWGAS